MGSAIGDIGSMLEGALGDLGGIGGGGGSGGSGGGGGLGSLLGGGGGGGGIGGILGALDPLTGLANAVGGMLEKAGVPPEIVDAGKIVGGCCTGDVCMAADGAVDELGDLSQDASSQQATTEMPPQSETEEPGGYCSGADDDDDDNDVDAQGDGDVNVNVDDPDGANVDVNVNDLDGDDVNVNVQGSDDDDSDDSVQGSGGDDDDDSVQGSDDDDSQSVGQDMGDSMPTGDIDNQQANANPLSSLTGMLDPLGSLVSQLGSTVASGVKSGDMASNVSPNDVLGWCPPDPSLVGQWEQANNGPGGIFREVAAQGYMNSLVQEMNANPSLKEAFEHHFSIELGTPVQTTSINGQQQITGIAHAFGADADGNGVESAHHHHHHHHHTEGRSSSSSSSGSSSGSGVNVNVSSGSDSSGSNQISQMMNDPSMSLEDKLEMLMDYMSNQLDQDINNQMNAVQAAEQKNKGSSSSSSNGNTDLQEAQQKLQDLITQRNNMFTMVSNMEKALGDTSSSILRNIGQ